MERSYCDPCNSPIFHNPVPSAGVTVFDGNCVLFVKRAFGRTAGDWMILGGHLEIDEQPSVAAARELHEETGLHVDPSDLRLFYVRTSEPVPGKGKFNLSLEYAFLRSMTGGELPAASDASNARFWTPQELIS